MNQRSSLLTTATVDTYCRDLRANGCAVHRDRIAGTVKVFDGEHVVFKAIQKGHGQPWIATFIRSERIGWDFREKSRGNDGP